MIFITKVKSYVNLSWGLWILSFIIGLLMVSAYVPGASYVYGAGFLNLGIVNIIGKLLTYRYEDSPFPVFFLLGMICPCFLGWALVMQQEQFFNILSFLFTYMAWGLLSIFHVVHVSTFRKCEEIIEQSERYEDDREFVGRKYKNINKKLRNL